MMEDVEAYALDSVKRELSASQVTKSLQTVESTIDRAKRPERGGQVLGWN
jgi:hypothetical protein